MLCDVTENDGRVQVDGLYKHFPRCAPWIPRNPRPVTRGSMVAVCNGYFEGYLFVIYLIRIAVGTCN
jgi:hypothetical protein